MARRTLKRQGAGTVNIDAPGAWPVFFIVFRASLGLYSIYRLVRPGAGFFVILLFKAYAAHGNGQVNGRHACAVYASLKTNDYNRKERATRCRIRRRDIPGARGCRGEATTRFPLRPHPHARSAASPSAPIMCARAAALTGAGPYLKKTKSFNASGPGLCAPGRPSQRGPVSIRPLTGSPPQP